MLKKVMSLCIAASVGTAAAQTDIYFNDFDSDDGGWVNSGTNNHPGDWEWEPNYDSSLYIGVYTPPPAAVSGSGLWGTLVYDDHTNPSPSSFNILSRTFDFSGFTNVQLSFWSWSNVFTNFDYCEILVNGVQVASNRSTDPVQQLANTPGGVGATPFWELETIDLSAFDNQNSVTVEFRMFATTVVNRAGWYIDDVRISGNGSSQCVGDIADSNGTLGNQDGQVDFGDLLALLGLAGPCPGGTPGCTGDIADSNGTLGNQDGQVDFGDLLALLGLAGPCP
jgi:hypothetical protein